MAVYAKLLDGDGSYDFLVRVVNLKDETKIAEIEAKGIAIKAPGSAELVLNFIGMLFPEAGKYEFQLYANGTYLHRATMNAMLIQGGPQWPQQLSRQ